MFKKDDVMGAKIILASESPRRKLLLEQIGLNFDVFPSEIEEGLYKGSDPKEFAEKVALEKAIHVAKKLDSGLILAADTIVFHQGIVLGKPQSETEAKSILKRLSNDVHQVITGLALIDASSMEKMTTHAVTKVYFREINNMEIDKYVASGEPMDKAGAYGIQGLGACFVEKIEGCYFNVVGLPISKLVDLLAFFEVDIF